MKRNKNLFEYLLLIAAIVMVVWCFGCKKEDGCGLKYTFDNVDYIDERIATNQYEQFDWKFCKGKTIRVHAKKTKETCNIYLDAIKIKYFTVISYPQGYEFTL